MKGCQFTRIITTCNYNMEKTSTICIICGTEDLIQWFCDLGNKKENVLNYGCVGEHVFAADLREVEQFEKEKDTK